MGVRATGRGYAALMAQPVIIDCDPGIDDALALMLAVGSPELDLLGVTCVAGNRPLSRTAPNARRVLDVAGATAVPVFAGCARPLTRTEPRSNPAAATPRLRHGSSPCEWSFRHDRGA